jgi:hypothetical protein
MAGGNPRALICLRFLNPALAELLFYVMATSSADADLEPTLSTANQFDLRTVDPREWAGSFNESLESPPQNDARLQISVRLRENFGYRGRCALADDLDVDHPTQGTSGSPTYGHRSLQLQ